MNAVVLHNPTAGDGSDRDEVLGELRSRGLTVLAVDESADALREHLSSAEVAVVVGGDGTVRELLIARRARDTGTASDHAAAPVAVVPFGTANNIARSLGVSVEDPYATLSDLHSGRVRIIDFDVGGIRVGSELMHFVESVGGGVIAEALRNADEIDSEIDGNAVGRAQIRRLTRRVQPEWWDVVIDGTDHSGDLVGLEVMNTASVGPVVELAPEARPHDGTLTVVLVTDSDRAQLADAVATDAVATDGPAPVWDLASHASSSEVRFRPPEGTVMHVDDEFVEEPYGWWRVTPGSSVPVLRGSSGDSAGVPPGAAQRTERS